MTKPNNIMIALTSTPQKHTWEPYKSIRVLARLGQNVTANTSMATANASKVTTEHVQMVSMNFDRREGKKTRKALPDMIIPLNVAHSAGENSQDAQVSSRLLASSRLTLSRLSRFG
jgi:hypothetical protein